MYPASATVVVPIAAAILVQAHHAQLSDTQQSAREDAASNAHKLTLAAEKKAREAERQEVTRSHKRKPAPVGSPKDIARALVSASQWPCLDSLWTRESGWHWNARNAASGAYGIPQSLPGSKMASAGSDWRTNPATQIKWGISYIRARYGSPCSAWAHSQNVGWY